MDVRSLRYFIAVAEHSSFSRAAEEVGVVQSAMSHRIGDLEDTVGTPLFHRDGRSIRLTEAGKILLPDARRIVRLIGQARDRLQRLSQGETGSLRIGFQSAACRRRIVSESFIEFRTRYPNIDLELLPMTGLSMEDALGTGELDGGFFYRHGTPPLSHRRLYVDNWLLALPTSHPLASVADLYLRDLRSENFIVLPRRITPILHDRIFAACAAGGLTPKVVQEAFEEPMVLNLVAMGLGVAFVLDSLPTELYGNVILKPVADFDVPTELCFLWDPANDNPTLNRFNEVLELVATRAENPRSP
jgi:DNA-binding transcriptional LysR family regulator